MKKTRNLNLKTKRIIAILSLLVAVGVFYLVAHFAVFRFISSSNATGFKEFIEGYGAIGVFVALGIQFLQVFVALIPGEFVEVGLGYAFGAVGGTLLCLLGVGLASSLIFLLVKRWGVRVVELFVSTEKINSLSLINSEKRLKRLVFILFLIPGTPKDLLTYIVPLTRIKMSEFLVISLIARIPSVVSSSVGGHLFEDGKYLEGIILLLSTMAVSLLGIFIYNKITAKYKEKRGKK